MEISLETMLAGDSMDLVRSRSAEYDMPQPVMATSAIMVIEVLHEDGLRYLHTFRPDEATAWGAAGMANYAAESWFRSAGDD